MTFTITIPLWTMLPLMLCILMLAGGLWHDRFAIDSILDFQATLAAIFLGLMCWTLVLYGRYDQWLVIPVLVTVAAIWRAWREMLKREARAILAGFLVTAWLLVVYGRLTA